MLREMLRFFAALVIIMTGSMSLALPAAGDSNALTAEGDQDGVQLVIKSLVRNEGDTVTLRFQIANNSNSQFNQACEFRDSAANDECGVLSGVYLIDQSNKKKYLVVRDSDGKCICASVKKIDKGNSQNLWATFQAPPAETQKETVVVPAFPPIDGVPVVASQ